MKVVYFKIDKIDNIIKDLKRINGYAREKK